MIMIYESTHYAGANQNLNTMCLPLKEIGFFGKIRFLHRSHLSRFPIQKTWHLIKNVI
jgi:hypothetical protein